LAIQDQRFPEVQGFEPRPSDLDPDAMGMCHSDLQNNNLKNKESKKFLLFEAFSHLD